MPEFEDYKNDLTPRSQQVLGLACREAKKLGSDAIEPEHILLGILKIGNGIAYSILQRNGVTAQLVTKEIELNHSPASNTQIDGNLPISAATDRVLKTALAEAQRFNYRFASTEHLLFGIISDPDSSAARILKALNIKTDAICNELFKTLDPNYFPPAASDGSSDGADNDGNAPAQPDPNAQDNDAPDALSALNSFGRNLTDLAQQGKLDPVIGRRQEIERVIQILCRRTKNNPVLIGEAGVGKTAIVEGLAQAIVNHEVPDTLADKQVYSLDLTLMIAGTKYRGQFEERIKSVMEEIRASGHIILFLDEIHTIIGAGSAEGSMDASNILKPALARGELQCVGATTLSEYRRIEKDAALERRFQTVTVKPPSRAETIEIIRGLAPRYEEHHGVRYTPEAIREAVVLADRYIPTRHFPDKAIDIIDEAGSRIRLRNHTVPADLQAKEKELAAITARKREAIERQSYEQAATLRDQEKALQADIESIRRAEDAARKANVPTVTVDDIRDVISFITGVPLTKIGQSESARLLQMEESLRSVVIGQDLAVHAIARSLIRSRAELRDPKRPIGSFLLLGPTGVGKTYLVKCLAEQMFGDPEALIRLDMSEFMDRINVSRLIGSTPGYVGYEDGGQLTEAVRRRPYSVVLFDEIEKAHQEVTNILLQILEEGQLTDGQGHIVSFRNTIIVMTSNSGAESVMNHTALGFNSQPAILGDYDAIRERLEDAARKSFKPEFLNRIDDIIVFRPLLRDDIARIVNLELDKIRKRLAEKGGTLTLEQPVIDLLIQQGFKPESGARHLKRTIVRHIEDPLAEILIEKGILQPIEEGAQQQTTHFEAIGHLTPDKAKVTFDISIHNRD